MAYTVPQMPLEVNVWNLITPPGPPPYGPPSFTTKAALRAMFTAQAIEITFFNFTCFMSLSVPAYTDLRPWGAEGGWTGATGSMVEVPAGTGRYYQVQCVDDVAKGFPNEYRFAILTQGYRAFAFPIP
jgi:hypothetical protein